ncbi:Symplekin [Vitis vinifera]|uniref:Symplekin n=1 Tax=Vitis vinifera TaxID=29760 RepID=A0A438HKL4_VITVI|nr:Symplekin [Vitis vinifera]
MCCLLMGHELTLRALYRLYGEAEEERDFFSSTNATSVYDMFLLTVAETLRDSFPASDKSLSRLLAEVPYLPKSVFKLLDCLCSPGNSSKDEKELLSGDRVTQGLSAVWNLILLRPPIRDACLKIALQSAVHHSEEVRMKAIRLVANKLYPLSSVAQQIEDFANEMLLSVINGAHATDRTETEGSSTELQKDSNLEKSSDEHSSGSAIAKEIASDTQQSCTSQTISSSSISEAQRSIPFSAKYLLSYKSTSKAVKQAVHRHIPILVRTIGSSPELLEIISDPPPGSKNLLTQVLRTLTDGAVPSPELIFTIRKLYDSKVKDIEILIPILSFLPKDEEESRQVHLGEMQRTNLLDQIWGMQALVVCWLELRLAVEVVMIEAGPLFGRRREGSIVWSVVQMREVERVGVVPTGGLKDPLSIELLSEAERVLAREKRRVKDNVLFMEKWYPEVGCFCTGTNVNEAWSICGGNPCLGSLKWCWREVFLGRGFQWMKKKAGGRPRVACSGRVLEKEVQSKGGLVLRDGLQRRICMLKLEDKGLACFLGGAMRESESLTMNARAKIIDEALAVEASRYDSFPAVFGGDRDFFSSSPSSGFDRAWWWGIFLAREGVREEVDEPEFDEARQKREVSGSSWDDSSLTKFSKSLGFTTEGVEGGNLKIASKIEKQKRPRIDVEEAAILEEVFTEEEVFSVLSDLNGDKALGPDGFSLSFCSSTGIL